VKHKKKQLFSPVQQEYFQRPYRRVYKECNRYKISTTTLENFGLIIDQGKRELPKVWSTDRMSINTPNETINDAVDKPFCCTHCGSEHYIRYGKKNGRQQYMCKECNRKFVDNLYFERLKGDPKIICLTLDLYFKGVSLRKICDHLKQFYGLKIVHVTLLNWLKRYIDIMDKYVSQFKPQIGNIWQADEMMIQIDGDWFYLWNVLDTRTRFHLASVISKERKIQDARKVFQEAKKRSHGKKPEFILTDGLQSYTKAIKKEFYTIKRETRHIGNVGLNRRCNKHLLWDNNKVERLHGTVRDRNKTQRGLEKQDNISVKGHQLYYNFIRPHMSLSDSTPADIANIGLNLGEQKWKNLLLQAIKNQDTGLL